MSDPLVASPERTRADTIGRVVWALVKHGARETTGRSIHLLAGLRPEHLAGVSRTIPLDVKDKTLLAIRKDIDEELTNSLPHEHLTDRAAVHFRNSDEADIILFAASDSERETIGASLNPVSRIDRNSLQQMPDLWRDEILSSLPDGNSSDDRRAWIENVLKGLNRSGIAKELDQFAEFVRLLASRPELPWDERIRLGMSAFKLPINCTGPIPGVDDSRPNRAEAFRKLFAAAERETSGYPYLVDPSGNPLDLGALESTIEESGLAETYPDAIAAIRALLHDAPHLKPGDWRSSQETFCNSVDWKVVGSHIFKARKKTRSKTLEERTRGFIESEYGNEFSSEDEQYLDNLRDGETNPEDDAAFFKNWQDRILGKGRRPLYEAWRKKLVPDEIHETDLQVAILRGVENLVAKHEDDGTGSLKGARVRLTTRNADSKSTWSALDARVYALFRLEGRLLQSVLAPHVEFKLGLWLDPGAINDARDQRRRDSRQVSLELSLIPREASEPSAAVRVYWEPVRSGHARIALAWPEDIQALYRSIGDHDIRVCQEAFGLKPSGESGTLAVNLSDTATFVDVTGREHGRTADPVERPREDDFFGRVSRALAAHRDSLVIDTNAMAEVVSALDTFRSAFEKAVKTIHDEPEIAFLSDVMDRQAALFGEVCQVARRWLHGVSDTRTTTLREIAEFGIATTGVDIEAAIIPAWHPLRLFERKSKAVDLSNFIGAVLAHGNLSSESITRSFADRAETYSNWYFPEALNVGFRTFATISHCGGYSFAVPGESSEVVSNELESTATVAAREYAAVADSYLALNPHEEGNFSTAIFNADTVALPSLVAEALEQRMQREHRLRCSLLITHDDSGRMRQIFAQQNALLRSQPVDEITEGFLSRLRVGVGGGESNVPEHGRPKIDIVLLHEAFRRDAEVVWGFHDSASGELSHEIDFRNALMPRRKANHTGAYAPKMVERSLSPSSPPRSCAQFLDLCHAVHRDERFIPDGKRASPARRLNWKSDDVRKKIARAHRLGEWVVSVDSMANRRMLSDSGVKIIRDIARIDSKMRVLVSSQEPSNALVRHIEEMFLQMEDAHLHQNSRNLARDVVGRVVEVCGKKILGSARSRITAREVVGLAAATALSEIDLERSGAKPIWYSLDDYSGFLGLSGKMADTLALTVKQSDSGRFLIEMTVVEAKCVAEESEAQAAKSSREQASSTLKTLQENFARQRGAVAREPWGLALIKLLNLRPDHVRFFEDLGLIDRFYDDLAVGNVDYRIAGKSVIVVHDDVSSDQEMQAIVASNDDAVWQYRIGQRALGRLLPYLHKSIPTELPTVPSPDGAAPQSIVEPPKEQSVAHPTNLASKDEAHHSPTASIESTRSDKTIGPPVSDNPAIPPRVIAMLHEIASANRSRRDQGALANDPAKTAAKLRAAIVEFGMTATLATPATTCTPNGILVHFRGHATLTVPKLEKRLIDLRTTHGLDVTDIRPGLGQISIFVASPKRQVVDLAQTWLDTEWPTTAPGRLANFLLGLREDNGAALWLNLQGAHGGNEEHMPHTLIAGETGSGKGVLTQNLLLQMIVFNSPSELKLFVIDPKHGVDFQWIADAPHLDRPLITTQEESVQALQDAFEEMERRYEIFNENHVAKLSDYNAKVDSPKKLPLVLVVHDEMADWMVVDKYRKAVSECLRRLSAKARAAGIHIVMITQRASQEAIPPMIRDNLGNRLCLRVSTEAGSRLALGMRGAERLLGKGHVAARLAGDKPVDSEAFIAQVPFATTEDLEHIARTASER